MAAATNVTPTDRRANFITGSFTLDPGLIAAGGREEQTVAAPEAKVGDSVQVNPRDALLAGIVIGHARVASAGSISFYLENHTAGGVDQASGTWDYALIRGNLASPLMG